MAEKQLLAKIQIRHSVATLWADRNPTLREGEFGLETNTFLLKIGDGVTPWNNLPYLNKLNSSYFKYDTDGSLTFSDSFATEIQNLISAGGGSGSFIIENDPVNPTDPVNLRYLQYAINHAGHLKRAVVQTLPQNDIDLDTLYMVRAQSNDHYEEYMYVNGAWDMVGTTGDNFTLEIATDARLGGVKSSALPDQVSVNTNTGFMTINDVSTSKLYVPQGDILILYGGTA